MPATDVVSWLATAYLSGMNDELLGDIINDVQHQGDTSEAMYAVAPHLLALSQKSSGKMALLMLIHAGLISASSQSQIAVVQPILQLNFKPQTTSAGQWCWHSLHITMSLMISNT